MRLVLVENSVAVIIGYSFNIKTFDFPPEKKCIFTIFYYHRQMSQADMCHRHMCRLIRFISFMAELLAHPYGYCVNAALLVHAHRLNYDRITRYRLATYCHVIHASCFILLHVLLSMLHLFFIAGPVNLFRPIWYVWVVPLDVFE